MRRLLQRCSNHLGGPRDPDAPLFDAVDGKRFEPAVMMRRLQSLLTGVPYDEVPEAEVELLAMAGEDGPRAGCCRFWARSLPWPVVRGRLVSACTAGSCL